VDYWTEEDQESIVQQVITALGTPVFGRVDADNNIILTGELTDGVYTIKYEDADGNVTEIGTLNHTAAPEPTYKNWIPLSTTTPGGTEIYNGKGYKENTRWSSSSAAESAAPGVYVTGCIPVSPGDVIRLKNIRMNKNDTTSNVRHICSWANSAWSSQDIAATADYKPVWDSDGNLTQFTMPNWGTTHIRLNTSYVGADSILTINEEIVDSDDMGDSGAIELTWTDGVKLDKDTGAEGSGDGYAASQHIELVDGYTYTFNQLSPTGANTYGGANICYYDADGNGLGYELLWDATSGAFSKALAPIAGSATFRVRLYHGGNISTVTHLFTLTYEKTA
jgi:hypothetical protein